VEGKSAVTSSDRTFLNILCQSFKFFKSLYVGCHADTSVCQTSAAKNGAGPAICGREVRRACAVYCCADLPEMTITVKISYKIIISVFA
jgi:hypothetical protein